MAFRSQRFAFADNRRRTGEIEFRVAGVPARRGGRILFTGNVPRERVAAYLKASDLFVLNSDYEGMPHVLLEAYAAGVPVVATSSGGTGELVEDGCNGLLIPPRRIDRLAEAVERLLSDDALRAKRVNNGRQTLRDRFQWETLVGRTENALMGLVPEGKLRR